MFGYIKPMTEELKVRENELYKSVYCGLCSAMGEHICTSNRLTLSYDIVFLALVRCCVTGENIHIEKKRCMAHPLKPRNRAYIPETLRYCARVSALLTYYNVRDDIEDGGKLKSKLLLDVGTRRISSVTCPRWVIKRIFTNGSKVFILIVLMYPYSVCCLMRLVRIMGGTNPYRFFALHTRKCQVCHMWLPQVFTAVKTSGVHGRMLRKVLWPKYRI